MTSFTKFYARHSRLAKVLVSLFLAAAILASYALIVLLFIRPQIFNLDSLIRPSQNADAAPYSRITPAVLVALFCAILTGSTAALITRCVEESLWRKLTPSGSSPVYRLSIAESRNLAQWSISAAARFRYIAFGDSWALRFCGILILIFAGVNPVLLSGITQKETSATNTTFRPSNATLGTSSVWRGFLDDVNTWFAGGHVRDLPGESAFLASLNALNAPAVSICNNDLCRINARMAGYQATCQSTEFTNLPYDQNTDAGPAVTLCSSHSDEVCVTLLDSNPATFANFTNKTPTTAQEGDFTIIFGAYKMNWSDIQEEDTTYTIDCQVRYGWLNVTQKGRNPPEVLRSSFYTVSKAELEPVGNYLWRIYGKDYSSTSPWYFAGGNYGANGERILDFAVGFALLGWRATADGPTVAQRIERAWDMNNIFAFGRATYAADLTTTTEIRTPLYVYNRLMLLALLVPLLATILGIWKRWYVQGDELMPGYDPVKIASYGPVYGIPPGLDGNAVDKLKVARYSHGGGNYQFMANGGITYTGSEAASPVQRYQTSLSGKGY